MHRSIGFRLNVLFVLLVTLLLAGSGAWAYWRLDTQLNQDYRQARSNLQQRLQINLVNPVWNLDSLTLAENLSAELQSPVLGIAVYLDSGELMGAKGLLPSTADSSAGDLDRLQFDLSTQQLNAPELLGRVEVLLSREELERTLRNQVWQRFAEVLALDLLLVAALSLSLRLQVLKPLQALRDALLRAAEHRDSSSSLLQLGQRDDEFGEVVEGFNRIAQRLSDDLEAKQHAEDTIRSAYEHLQQTQVSLVEAEKLAALGGLVAGVAHEINTPLGISLTGASLLAEATRRFSLLLESGQVKKSELDGYLQTARESVELILANAQRAAHLVHSFKQVAVDQTSEARRSFELASYLDEVIESLRPTFKRRPIEVRNDCPVGIQLDGYPGALAQVVTNLLVNALTHAFAAPDSGLIRLSGQTEGEHLCLIFEDDGCGIAPKQLPHIFEPFFTTRRGSGGSGLGLHVVYNLITKRMGGQIAVTSAPGQGTRFSLHLPLVAPLAEGQPI
ncbi:sensor histidine kinase [Pseudomonas sp.]|uniref:sensor histidine kinase n=1 Tax=Pseudomonas sp. TaxID=306 RepID=UPI0027347CE2|nr:ATP-binding protein [Pseudomonas sp.]MDP3813885.1 ATP-binding protein [Pseudomonas sp.]